MRIELKERKAEHVRIYFERSQDQAIKRMLPQKASSPEEALEDYYISISPESRSFGRTIYIDGSYVGDIWCYCMFEDEEPDAMLSFCVFEKSLWNKGIAKSAVALFLGEISERFGIKTVGAFTYKDNAASIALLKATGFTAVEDFVEDGRQSVYFQKELSDESI